jgi:2-oxo-4-hydroxy-4-carboxy-5-ureidoimidazoline decarboxylase
MSLSLDKLNVMPEGEAAPLLASCCGASAWVTGMLSHRPFGDTETLLRAADEVWWSLESEDWHEAFAHHPRIGERKAAARQDTCARDWSTGEQRGVAAATADLRTALAEGNRHYERRFGYIYLVAAAGKSADDLLGILQARLSNDPDTELRVAAGEQAKITRLRLLKLLGAPEADR